MLPVASSLLAAASRKRQQRDDLELADEQRVFVRLDRAPFLAQFGAGARRFAPVSIVKDPTSDFAKLARKGSDALRTIKFEQEQQRARDRVWDVSEAKIGRLTGEAASSSRADETATGRAQMQYQAHLSGDEQAPAAAAANAEEAIQQQRASLPIYRVRQQLMQCIRENNVVILVGETGSGKTTQLTQYCLEEGYARSGSGKQMIACTQPRRVAAVSVAKRVSEELGCRLGETVSYAIRFDDVTSDATLIRYMTDGILLRESLRDPDFAAYSVIVMDEAHERSLNTDLLFGILRRVLQRRHDLKLIVTSATLNAQRFAEFFGGAPVFPVPGRTFEVSTFYMRSIPDDYVEAAVRQILSLHMGPPGDVLVFMTGEADVEATCELAAARWQKFKASVQSTTDSDDEQLTELLLLPLYSQLHADQQTRIFNRAPPGQRKCIVASNIAETSLTIDGIVYVIDSGLCKVKVYSDRVGMDLLEVVPISRANADQRAGRAGRTGPGKCYRLYTDTAYVHDMHADPVPEIQRTQLAHVVLLLQSLGVDNLLDFPFMDPPPPDNLAASLQQLWMHGAVDDAGRLTDTGRRLVAFPIDTAMASMLLASQRLGCSDELVTVVAMLSVQPVFYRPKQDAERSDAMREKFAVPEADHLTLLNVYNQWRANGCSSRWCADHYVHARSMQRARAVREQLLDIVAKSGIAVASAGSNWDAIRECVCAGYFHHAAKFKGVGEYVSLVGGMSCYIHPQSALFGQAPSYIVYHELLMTTKEYVSVACEVRPEWLAHYGARVMSLAPFPSLVAAQSHSDAQPSQTAAAVATTVDAPQLPARQHTSKPSSSLTSLRRRRLI